ncbi:MAG: cupin domain-containing protein [Acidimicrobiales bacterium]
MAVAVTAARRGTLRPGESSPARGEALFPLLGAPGLEVRQVLSGELEAPVDYLQEEDEWALVVTGSALLEVDDAVIELGPGDWVWLPAGTPHRLLRTEPGTSWVTVHHRPHVGPA